MIIIKPFDIPEFIALLKKYLENGETVGNDYAGN